VTHDNHYLLVCTVGGTAEPIVAAVRYWKPARVLFVPSSDTKAIAESVTREEGLLQPGAWDILELHDAQHFEECVQRIRRLDEQILAWTQKGVAYKVIADFTGGTKCMSAALSLVARRWACLFSYVGGTERTKGGTGIVVSGSEETRITQNPWDALGYQAIEDAGLLFDQHAFVPAANLLSEARKAADDDAVKRCLSTFHQLCEGYGLWDRFQHRDAIQRIGGVLKNAADVHTALGSNHADKVIRCIKGNELFLKQLVVTPRSRAIIGDLLANASRRQRETRYDDGVARLYRAVESIAQLTLAEHYGIPNTGEVDQESLPEALRARWAQRVDDGKLQLGLQDAYALLDEFGDGVGKAFKDLQLNDPQRSPLVARNQSLLAHGFQPVGPNVFDQLWNAAVKLGGFTEAELPTFPKLVNP
jgi:CRISPR-associated protein (TIGR02710 family)